MIKTIPLTNMVIMANEKGKNPTCNSISEEVKNAKMPTAKQTIPGTIHFALNALQLFAIQSIGINGLCMSNRDSEMWLMMQKTLTYVYILRAHQSFLDIIDSSDCSREKKRLCGNNSGDTSTVVWCILPLHVSVRFLC